MRLSRTPSTYPVRRATHFEPWPRITAEQLVAVRDLFDRPFPLGRRVAARQLSGVLRRAVLGPIDDGWEPPAWLEIHQRLAARRISASLRAFGGSLLADAVGLGKTFVALAVAGEYDSAVLVVPAMLKSQWASTAEELGIHVAIVTHEALSRGADIPLAPLIVVDEAHRFRNPTTRRHHHLSRQIGRARLLLVTATPVVNRAADLATLLRLFAPDNAFALFGIASLEGAAATRRYADLASGAAPAIVARSADAIPGLGSLVPRVRDRAVIRAATLPSRCLRSVLAHIDALEFPTFDDTHERGLLRLHLAYRLASSAAACRESVRRHLAYIDRALAAVARGTTLSRATARRLFRSDDELQLELGDLAPPARTSTRCKPALEADRDRLRRVMSALPETPVLTPKVRAVTAILRERAEQKTIVFTTAVATALDLARTLRWQEVAVVGSGKAWIASGPIGVDEALSLFAPQARNATDPPAQKRVMTLIATDLAAEGLNLQDASAVVHFDLPWTPLRLEQRIGRIARLRSEHRTVRVWWFAPHREIERRIGLERRIAGKARCQLGLGVAVTSRVGRARMINHELASREAIGCSTVPTPVPVPAHAVVQGPIAAAVAVAWKIGRLELPELLIFAGEPLVPVRNYETARWVLDDLLARKTSSAWPSPSIIDCIARLTRRRLSEANRGPCHVAMKRIARKIVQRGYVAGRSRDERMLRALDAVLDRARAGLSQGAERELEELVRASTTAQPFHRWLASLPDASSEFPECRVVAALLGDGIDDGGTRAGE